MSYRKLTDVEISSLENQGCQSDDWSRIEVPVSFSPSRLTKVQFSGDVKLGNMSGSIELEPGIVRDCTISDSFIENCIIEDDVYINNCRKISNYIISNNAAIENTGTLVTIGESAFGNGTEIDVFNEGGGRELPIVDRMSAQVAYLMVMYRHEKNMINALKKIISSYAESKRADKGVVETGVRIRNCREIINVHFGAYGQVRNAAFLYEGTVGSTKDAPTIVGESVIAKHFIFQPGSQIDGGALIDHSLVGQGTRIGKQYSMENTVFFANSEGFHGEAVSVFGGPYTVTHHKSTLLIAGLFSFYNAGSGTNQSNHMYKLGPLHQGVLERGSKTGSFSYLLWPCRVGAFSVVTDKHSTNFDTSEFPFSYVTVEEGKSFLTPAMNLFTVGTKRDSEKWPKRDRRKGAEKYDLIQFELLNPHIVGQVLKAIDIFGRLYESTPKEQQAVNHKGIRIKRLMLKTGKKYYELMIPVFIGNQVIKRIGDRLENWESVKQALKGNGSENGSWYDLAGMLAAESRISKLIDEISKGKIAGYRDLAAALQAIHDHYEQDSWNWCLSVIDRWYGGSELSVDLLVRIIEEWKINSIKLNNMIQKDAMKEFDQSSMIGFGIDGDELVKAADFEAVRGTYETNSFVKQIRDESEAIAEKADRMASKLMSIG